MGIDNKTLIILSPGFPANEADSTCLPFPQLFVRKLNQLNPSLKIIVLAFQYPFVEAEYEWYGVQVIAFNGRNIGKLRRLMVWNAAWKRLKMITKENEVLGILNFWLGECALIGKYAARKYQLRSFTWLLGQDARSNNRYFSLVKPGPETLIALSEFIADEFSRNYRFRPAHTIPPGIDPGSFSTINHLRDIDIFGAGSLIPLKRYDIFIKIIAKLAKDNPGIKTMICGEGKERGRMQQLIKENNLENNIELCGELSHDKVLALMQRTKVFLHPSEYEGFSTVLSEALYAGAHVVSFCSPMDTVFKHQHTVTTETEMLEKVNLLLNDVHLDHEKIMTWPIDTVCKKILSLYGA